MHKRFKRGKQLVTIVIAMMLIMNGITFLLSRSLLLSWYREALTTAGKIDTLQVESILDQFVSLDQRSFLVSQATSYAFLIFCCIILYLGYSWIRWLWGIGWLIKGASGLFAASLLVAHFGLWTNLVLFAFGTSLLYTLCALCILCSPSVHTYMHMMRR